ATLGGWKDAALAALVSFTAGALGAINGWGGGGGGTHKGLGSGGLKGTARLSIGAPGMFGQVAHTSLANLRGVVHQPFAAREGVDRRHAGGARILGYAGPRRHRGLHYGGVEHGDAMDSYRGVRLRAARDRFYCCAGRTQGADCRRLRGGAGLSQGAPCPVEER